MDIKSFKNVLNVYYQLLDNYKINTILNMEHRYKICFIH